jgi:hypothetical protein
MILRRWMRITRRFLMTAWKAGGSRVDETWECENQVRQTQNRPRYYGQRQITARKAGRLGPGTTTTFIRE